MGGMRRSSNEFEEFCSRATRAVSIVTGGLASESLADIHTIYRRAVRFIFSILAAVIADARGAAEVPPVTGRPWDLVLSELGDLWRRTHVGLFRPADYSSIHAGDARRALNTLLGVDDNTPLGAVYFETMPASWVGTLYERLLGLKPRRSVGSNIVELRKDSGLRKLSGSFFTPAYLVDYIVAEAVDRLRDREEIRVLDPSMGTGDFLLRALDSLSAAGIDSADAAVNSLFGCDVDPIAVDIARFLVWLETGGRADAREIERHLICADALGGEGFLWYDAFPDAFSLFALRRGFDAVIGNPPYIAAKNARKGNYAALEAQRRRGQSDYYLLFLESVIGNKLVCEGGVLAMVLPDPFLVRANAAEVRRKLLKEWTVEKIVHISGAFPGAQVANVVPICINRRPQDGSISAVRLDRASLRRRFQLDPAGTVSKMGGQISPAFALVQPKAEVLYLVQNEWKEIFARIHGADMSIGAIRPPFVFLKDIGVEAVFRGEEIGKSAIRSSEGDRPILLGGESVHRYSIRYEGRRVQLNRIEKPIHWYSAPKIVLQKSSAKINAALDDVGYIVPQSVYCVKLKPDGLHPLYLLALLNSRFLNDYTFRAFTGYKMVQPQIELEDLRGMPIRMLAFTLDAREREALAAEGRKVFEQECERAEEGFPSLSALVKEWLASNCGDAVHDLLVFLAGHAVKLRSSENADGIRIRLVDNAIDSVVYRLYGVGQ